MHFSGKQLSKKIRWLKYSGPGSRGAGGKKMQALEHGRGSQGPGLLRRGAGAEGRIK